MRHHKTVMTRISVTQRCVAAGLIFRLVGELPHGCGADEHEWRNILTSGLASPQPSPRWYQLTLLLLPIDAGKSGCFVIQHFRWIAWGLYPVTVALPSPILTGFLHFQS